MAHRFTIPDYFDYGDFRPRECAELPGKLFRARARGDTCPSTFLVNGSDAVSSPALNTYSLAEGDLYAAWRVKRPEVLAPGGRYSYVRPGESPWQIWLERADTGAATWIVQLTEGERTMRHAVPSPEPRNGWDEIRLTLQPEALTAQIDGQPLGRWSHDRYPERFHMHFGSAQLDPDGAEVVSEYRHVFFDRFPYPDSPPDSAAEGPEDVTPEDEMIRLLAVEATPTSPRHSEGDLITRQDGSLLLVWTDYFQGKGWDRSPARLSAKTSSDGGRTWGQPWTAVDSDRDSAGGNVMSVSLVRARSGDLLMAHHGQTREMKAKGMLLRRSADDGRTWSEPIRITPDTGNVHAANNACFRRLRGGRILLSCREYIDGVRQPYALYSDDDGQTWQAGELVPAADLTPDQIRRQNINEPSVAEIPDGRLIMMMRSVAGGHFFACSSDQGQTWSKPYLSPLRGIVAPPHINSIPGAGDLLAIWSRGLTERSPLHAAISRDGGQTWGPVKLLDRSEYHGYGYTSVTFVKGRALITTMRYPLFPSLERFTVEPGYTDLLYLSLPLEWFYRTPED